MHTKVNRIEPVERKTQNHNRWKSNKELKELDCDIKKSIIWNKLMLFCDVSKEGLMNSQK